MRIQIKQACKCLQCFYMHNPTPYLPQIVKLWCRCNPRLALNSRELLKYIPFLPKFLKLGSCKLYYLSTFDLDSIFLNFLSPLSTSFQLFQLAPISSECSPTFQKVENLYKTLQMIWGSWLLGKRENKCYNGFSREIQILIFLLSMGQS